MSGLGTTGLVATGVAINFTYSVQKGVDYFPSLLAGGMFMLGCAIVGDVFDPAIGTGIAALFLLSSLLNHGVSVMDTLVKTITPKGK